MVVEAVCDEGRGEFPHQKKKSAGSDLGMELKAGSEDIENGPRKVEKNEENWIKRVKIKF